VFIAIGQTGENQKRRVCHLLRPTEYIVRRNKRLVKPNPWKNAFVAHALMRAAFTLV
jgi:hypothetical protein